MLRARMMGMILVAAYISTIPAANWLIGHWGTVCVPGGPCLFPVFPGLMAPSGVLMIGAALVLRDLVQRRYGVAVSLACVAGGAALSAFVAPPALAAASGAGSCSPNWLTLRSTRRSPSDISRLPS